jgi:hypothetical protein
MRELRKNYQTRPKVIMKMATRGSAETLEIQRPMLPLPDVEATRLSIFILFRS